MSAAPNPFADEPLDATGNLVNPYASPASISPGGAGPGVGVWRQGPLLVMHLQARFPLRCVYTNQPCDLLRTRSMSYSETLNPIPRMTRFEYGVASYVESQVSRTKGTAGGLMVLSGAMVIGGTMIVGPASSTIPVWLPFLYLVFGPIGFISLVYYLGKKELKYARYEKSYLWLKGAGPAFLDSLPDWPGFIQVVAPPTGPRGETAVTQAQLNPFADDPPGTYAITTSASEAGDPGIGMWREGTLLVIHRGATFPERCIFTNEPAVRRRRQAINSGGIGETIRFEFGVSDGIHQRTQRNQRLALMVAGIAGGLLLIVQLGLLILGPFTHEVHGTAGVPLAVILAVGLALAFSPPNTFQFVQGDSCYLWLKGAGPPFLESLPEWPGYRR